MDWIQIHLALNHVPVIGFPILLLLLVFGWVRGEQVIVRHMLWSIALLAVAAIVIKFTGDFAAEQYPEKFSTVKELVTAHEEAGDQATTGVFLLGIAAGSTLFLARQGRSMRWWLLATVIIFGLVTILLYARSAHSGGQISHPEVRAK